MSEGRLEKVIEDKKSGNRSGNVTKEHERSVIRSESGSERSGKDRWMGDRHNVLDDVMKGRQESREQFFRDMEEAGVSRDMFKGKRMPTVPAVRVKMIEMIRGHGQKVAGDLIEITDYYERQLLGRDKTIANLKERNERRKFYR